MENKGERKCLSLHKWGHLGGFPGEVAPGTKRGSGRGKGQVTLYVRTVSGGSREDAGLDPSLEFKALPTTSWIPQERTVGVEGR